MGERNDILEAIKNVNDNQVNIITVAKELLDGKEQVTLNLQKSPVKPQRLESPPRTHVFHSVQGFISYLEKNQSDNLVVLADTSEQIATAVLDDRAEYGREFVTFDPPHHPQFVMLKKSLLDINPLNIVQFALAVMRNREVIVGQDGVLFNNKAEAKQFALNMKQITVSSKVTAQTGLGADSTNSVMCQTKITGTDSVGEKAELPQSIEVQLPIYLHTEPVLFSINLTVIPRGESQADIITDAPEVDVRKLEVFEAVLTPLKELDGGLLSYGSLQEGRWGYLNL